MAFDETMNNTNTSLLEELIMKTSDDCHHHQDYDALSFCDLPIDNYTDLTDKLQPLSDTCPKTTPPAGPTHVAGDRLFEFMTSPDAHHARADSIVFCGKTIVPRKEAVRGGRRKTDDKPREKCSGSGRSGLFRLGGGGGGGSHSRPGSPASCSPWRSPKVEAVEVAKRRRSPARKLPATGGGAEGRMSSGGAHRDGHHHHHNNNNNNNNHWRGLLKPLRCGASFMSALTKAAFGLIPHV